MSERVAAQFEEYWPALDAWFEGSVCPAADGLTIEARDITGRKRHEQELQESRRRFELIAETTPDAVFIFDVIAQRQVYVSAHCEQITGYTAVECERMGSSVARTIVLPDDLPEAESHCKALRTAADGQIIEYDYRIAHRNGSIRWVRSRSTVFTRDRSGQVREIIGIFQDITDRKQAEDALRASEERLRLLVDSAQDFGIVTLDAEGRLNSWSRGAERLFGYTEDDVIGQPVEILFTPEERGIAVAEREMRQARAEGRVMEERFYTRKDGTRFFGSGVMTVLRDDGAGGYAKITRDLTERRRAADALTRANDELEAKVLERTKQLAAANVELLQEIDERAETESKLRRSETYLADGQRLSHVGSGSWNVRTGQVFWSEETYRIYGFEPGTVAPSGELFFNIVHPEDRQNLARLFERVARERSRYEAEFRIVRADGTTRYIRSVGHPYLNDAGDLIEVVGTVMDMTERVHADQVLAQSQADLAHASRVLTLGELTASIAHEVNQPLAAVVTNAQACARWLAMEPANLSEANDALQRIVRDATRASSVISRIRAFVQRAAPRKTLLDVNDLVIEVLTLLHGDARIRGVLFQVELSADLPHVMGDRVQVQQVILNLVVNGIEAMNWGEEQSKLLTVRTARYAPDAIVVSVSDSGKGLDPHNRDRVFEAFYTTKPEGMGMGLAISRSIVEAHGGLIWSAPNKERGETFQFTLPVERAAP
jgi:PAS domain S-box-containing protein